MLKKEELPEGALIFSSEKHLNCLRGIVFSIDHETKAMCVEQIFEGQSIADILDMVDANSYHAISLYYPCWKGDCIRYTKGDQLSNVEVAEASIGIPPFQSAP